MRVELSPQAQQVAQSLVDTGAYASIDEAVNALVQQASPGQARGATDDPEVARRQYEAHLQLMEKVAKLTDPRLDDGLSNRDHDAILYR
ncbi:MAG: hypothetical protein ACRCT8_01355 [Lacipirellulaceae bacterium]